MFLDGLVRKKFDTSLDHTVYSTPTSMHLQLHASLDHCLTKNRVVPAQMDQNAFMARFEWWKRAFGIHILVKYLQHSCDPWCFSPKVNYRLGKANLALTSYHTCSHLLIRSETACQEGWLWTKHTDHILYHCMCLSHVQCLSGKAHTFIHLFNYAQKHHSCLH